jgi:hypothetical protein
MLSGDAAFSCQPHAKPLRILVTGAYGVKIVAEVVASCYPGGMFTEIDEEERELLSRLRVLECITPRIRAAEAGLCACVTWRSADLASGYVEIVRMECAG